MNKGKFTVDDTPTPVDTSTVQRNVLNPYDHYHYRCDKSFDYEKDQDEADYPSIIS